MIIAGYLKTSLIEWPGKIASVIFTRGCNFRCSYCHNRDLVDEWMSGGVDKWIKQSDVLADLEKRKKWVDAVVVTGGEPTLQDDLAGFLGSLGNLGFLRMVETNGSRPEVVKRLIGNRLVDYWTMDIKSNFENYFLVQSEKFPPKRRVGAVQGLVEKVKVSMGLIANSGVEYEFRTTVVPGIHDLENLRKMAEEIREICEKVPQVSQVSHAKNTKHQTTNYK